MFDKKPKKRRKTDYTGGYEVKKRISCALAFCMLFLVLAAALPVTAQNNAEERMLMLQDFSDYDDLSPADQSKAGYAHPVTSLTSEHTDTGTGLKSEWKSSGSLRMGINTFRPDGAWVTEGLAKNAKDYTYLRFWISNRSAASYLRLSVRLFEGASNKSYFIAGQAHLTQADGTVISIETGNAGGYGEGSSMRIPAGFEGWVAYELRSDKTKGSGSGRTEVKNFADVNTLEIDVRLPDNAISNSYYVIDDICLTDSTVRVSEEPGEVWTPPVEKTDDLLMLQNFDEFDDMMPFDQSGAGYSLAVTSSTTEHTDTGAGFKAVWVATGNLKAGVHTFRPNSAWVQEGFAKNAGDYTYLRFWISNPAFTSLELTVRMYEGSSNRAYFISTLGLLIRKDGTFMTIEEGNAGGFGEESSMTIPSAFEGWVAFKLEGSRTMGAGNGRNPISNFADVNTLEIDVRRPDTTTSGDYYVLDDICLTNSPTGTLRSLEEEENPDDVPGSEEGTLYSGIKNVILLIGDGMGPNQLEAARRQLKAALAVDSMPVSGMVCTDNALGQLTDSAAAGTALSAGIKTTNGTVARDPYGKRVQTLLEYFAARNKTTGLVTTSYLLDATPATFGSHVNSRGSYTSIAKSFFSNDISVLLGGGTDEFSASIRDYETGAQMTLTEYAKQMGYSYVTNLNQLNAVENGKVLGLFAPHYMSYENARPATEPSIADLTRKAISLLSENEDGFFLMVEAGNIDHAGHANQLATSNKDTIAFSDAVQAALDFLKENPDTLIIVTADHETGGLTEKNGTFIYTTSDHTRADVPYFAAGKGCEYFRDLEENTEISLKIRQAATELDPQWIEDNGGAGENPPPAPTGDAVLPIVAVVTLDIVLLGMACCKKRGKRSKRFSV